MAKIILEGCDRLGKSTLINGILNSLGYHQVMHFEKPRLLAIYQDEVLGRDPLRSYQEASFKNMFKLLSAYDANIICDRSHIGEAVYSDLYRNYDGNYVFDLEDAFIGSGSSFHLQTTLILLTTDNFGFITDDGMSFDFSKKEEEQNRFIKAVNRSKIKNKRIINVHNGQGGFKTPKQILDEIL